MRYHRRALAAIASLGIAASTFPIAGSASSISVAAATQAVARVQVAAVPRVSIAVRDFGRRAALAPVSATLVLHYNNEAQLNALVEEQGNPASPLFHRFLTSAQFNNYFAPTQQQHAAVVAALQAAGLRVSHVSANRTVIDVVGTSAAAEQFFGTEIHSLAQANYGARFANVRPATIPAALAPLIRSVSLSNLVVVRPRPLAAGARAFSGRSAVVAQNAAARRRRQDGPGRFTILGSGANGANIHALPSSTNVVKDPGFESGGFSRGWQQCETPTISSAPQIKKTDPDTGVYSGFDGSTGTSEPIGYAGVCQLVTIPTSGILTADLAESSNEKSAQYAAQDVFLINTSGYLAAIVQQTAINQPYVAQSWNLSNFAGKTLYVYFGVHGDGASSFATKQYVDNVSLLTGTPAPSIPIVYPNVSANCIGAPENGPLSQQDADGSTGFLPTGVAKAFDFPVQHGCNGAGKTAAIVINAPVKQSDVDLYMNAAGVTQTGTLNNIPVDGGAPLGTDAGEASLDAETVIGLAPAATVNVYAFPDFSDQSITDAYNRVVSDNTAVAVNSSFGGCETSSDEGFDAIAVQGAALGITFVGTSGDTGSDECNDGPGNPPSPSLGVSSNNGPHFVSIGSINFTENSSGTLTGIQTASAGTFESGGGVSTVYALPRYQSGIANVITSGRNQPDLALPGDNVTIYLDGASVTTGGTSWSGPIFTALLTTAAELHGARGFGFANPMIYNMFKDSGYRFNYIDSTTGNNGAYFAKTGYDQVTGIGVPKGQTFALAL
jgi:subtilase family serine protease